MPGRKASEEQRREQILAATLKVAAKERLEGVTVRRVAAEARLSSGLVFFHFASKDALLVALLDWLIEALVARVREVQLPEGAPRDRFLELVRQRIAHLPEERDFVELFFDYWVMGTRHQEMRGKIREALQRYRDAFRPLAEELLASAPERFPGVTAEGLAAVAVSFIQGCAMQSVMDPGRFDVEQFMWTLEALVARAESQGLPPPPPRKRIPAPRR
ncbi:TetR/AcrR family transcriptional regulator [Vitiosangium sp. GDMCC 1.1324]|uniref:TetR/AcrR family transcriptional regulator n=1 Tax=Vitiosangium sp. (strain GDMCC 1.1324) TaxID=2138576 RepID=UPI00130D83A6|nr:TetR/AcrR family transcriptional regulator [Vitiosangium sp. GDMCC 1.1324]